ALSCSLDRCDQIGARGPVAILRTGGAGAVVGPFPRNAEHRATPSQRPLLAIDLERVQVEVVPAHFVSRVASVVVGGERRRPQSEDDSRGREKRFEDSHSDFPQYCPETSDVQMVFILKPISVGNDLPSSTRSTFPLTGARVI